MRDYTKIKAFQLADELVLEVYKITNNFPKEEIYGITSQIRRAAVSIPTNIAEGASRQFNKEYLQFLYISRGSLKETEYLLSLAFRLNYFFEKEFEKIHGMVCTVSKALFGLIRHIENEK